jgi:ribosomal protein S21
MMNVQVVVRNGDLSQALRRLKKKMEREGVIGAMRRGAFYHKPCEARRVKQLRAIRRARKMAAKFL